MQRVLIVEDEQTLAFALQESLVDEGLEVDVAGDGEEALQKFGLNPYDVVVTDLRMPRMTGLELLSEIRKTSSNTEVIIVTAYGSIESTVEALRLHAFDFVMKPYAVESLKGSIKRALERAALSASTEAPEPVIPVKVRSTGNGGRLFSASWASDQSQQLSFCMDIEGQGNRSSLVYFEADTDLIGGNPGLLDEVRGYVRWGILKKHTLVRIKENLKEYLEGIYGIQSGWHFLIAVSDMNSKKLKLSWEGHHQHVLFSRKTGKAHNLLSHPQLRKTRNSSGEYSLTFSGGDSLLFVSNAMANYINKRMGFMEFLSVVESSLRDRISDPAEVIRHAIRNSNDVSPPGLVVVASNDNVKFSNQLTITVPSEKKSLAETKYFAEQVCSQCGFSEIEIFDVVTALNEALLNSITHGYRRASGDIKVLFAKSGSRLDIEVEDSGSGFVPRLHAIEPEGSYEWVTRSDGRGLSMISKLMDKVTVDSSPGKGTTIKMSKTISDNSGDRQ